MAKKLKRGKWCFERSTPGNWWCDFKLAGHQRVREALPGAATKEDAEAAAAHKRKQLAFVDQGLIKADDVRAKITVLGAVADFWENVSSRYASAATAKGFGDNLVKTFGTKYLDELARPDIDRHITRRRKADDVSDGTLLNELSYLKRVMRRAGKTYAIADIDFDDLGLVKAENRDVMPLTFDQERAILSKIAERRPDYLPAIQFAFATGRRLSNVTGLLKSEVLWDQGAHGSIRQRVKSKRGKIKIHTLPLDAETAALVRAQWDNHPTHVFTFVCKRSCGGGARARVGGRRYPFTHETWRELWHDVTTELGLPGFRFHDVRHHVLSHIVDLTGDITNAQHHAGHSRVGTTETYVGGRKAKSIAAGVDALAAARRASATQPTPPDPAQKIAQLERELAELRAQTSGANVVQLPRRATA